MSSHEQHKLTPTKFTAVGFFDGGFVVVVVVVSAVEVGLPDLLPPCDDGRTGMDVVVVPVVDDGDSAGGSFITLAKVLADLLLEDIAPTELTLTTAAVSVVVVSDNALSDGEGFGNGSFSALVSFPIILADLDNALLLLLLLFADFADFSLLTL